MEKIIFTARTDGPIDPVPLAEALMMAGAMRVRLNVRDGAVAPADALIQRRGESLPDVVVQLWLDSANPMFRAGVDGVMDAYVRPDSVAAWLVSESTIIANTDHPPLRGQRTFGFAQMAFLTLPPDMAWADWRAIWRDSHTRIAIDTQSNFEYRQNLVVEALIDTAPPFVAIVEECFPPEAMTDPLTFFDAPGDMAKFQANLKIMMDSCARFIAPSSIDVFATSQFDFG